MALDGTMDIPGSSYDLISVGVLDDAGLITTFANRRGEVRTPEGEVLLIAPKIDGLYRLRVGPDVVDQLSSRRYSPDQLLSAHEVMRHLHMDRVRKFLHMPKATPQDPNPICESCKMASMREKKSGKEALLAAPRYGYRLHSDMSRKMLL